MLITQKHHAFNNGDDTKEFQRAIKRETKRCKYLYGKKLEEKFHCNDSKAAWKVMSSITGHKQKRIKNVNVNKEFVNELNDFYCRFDESDFKAEHLSLCAMLTDKCNITNTIIFSVDDVTKLFSNVKVNKACGPDNLSNKVIRSCAAQLAPIFTEIFQCSIDSGEVPLAWKTSAISPVPKSNKITALNDYRPIALTSTAMKCFEKLILKLLLNENGVRLDPSQFAYQAKKGVDDAVLMFLHKVLSHLETPKSFVRATFVDFSSAFNSIQPHLLINKLLKMGVSSRLTLWILNYLRDRPQFVRLNGLCSEVRTISTGAPQGCCLSPILFCLYTNDYSNKHDNCSIIKYADDTVITGYLFDDTVDTYKHEINDFVSWCKQNYLILNTKKTKEVVFDFRKKKCEHAPSVINNEEVEQVHKYEYLGTLIDDKLTFSEQVDATRVKAHRRLFFLRKLKTFNVDNTILKRFFQSVIQSVLTFNIICFYGLLTNKSRSKLERIVKIARRVCGKDIHLQSVFDLYSAMVSQKTTRILKDKSHLLFPHYNFCPSGKRLRMPRSTHNRFRFSFVPNSISIFNKNVTR